MVARERDREGSDSDPPTGTPRLQPPCVVITALGAHGQTMYHAPPHTLQLLDAAHLVYSTNITVVSDFRRADCAVGGQGAPLVPFAERALLAHPTRARVLLNLGGIANVTLLPPAGVGTSQPIAFDTGPANCIVDALVRLQSGGERQCDVGGELAAGGRADAAVVEAFAASPYVTGPFPKSTDTPAMLTAFQALTGIPVATPGGEWRPDGITLRDACATAVAVTARTVTVGVVSALRWLAAQRTPPDSAAALLHPSPPPPPPPPVDVVVSGGGVDNGALMAALRSCLAAVTEPSAVTRGLVSGDIEVVESGAVGIPAAAKEAVAFAVLAAAAMDGVPNNVPACTGATRSVVGGSITRPVVGE